MENQRIWSIEEFAKNLFRATVRLVFRYSTACLRWTITYIYRATATLMDVLHVTDMLRSVRKACLNILKWFGITVTSVVFLRYVLPWSVREIQAVREEHRRRELEENRHADEKARRADRAAVIAALEQARILRAEQEQASKDRLKEKAAAKETKAKLEYVEWEARCKTIFKSRALMDEFPFPPLPKCVTPGCQASSQAPAPACAHSLEQFLRDSGKFSPALLRQHLSDWHPDRFSSCRPEVKTDIQYQAGRLFILLQPLYEQHQNIEGKARPPTTTE